MKIKIILLALVLSSIIGCRKDAGEIAETHVPAGEPEIPNGQFLIIDVFGQHYEFYPETRGIVQTYGYNHWFENNEAGMEPQTAFELTAGSDPTVFSSGAVMLPFMFFDSTEYVNDPSTSFLEYFTNQNFIRTPSIHATLPNGQHLNALGHVLLGDWIDSYQVLNDTYPVRVRCQAELELVFQHPAGGEDGTGMVKFDLVFTQ